MAGRILILALGVCLARPGLAAIELHLEAEAGPELDTNANRVQPLIVPCPAGQSCVAGQCRKDSCTGAACATGLPCTSADAESAVLAGLLRLTALGRIAYRVGDRHLLSAAYGGGGKVFLGDEARSADELVQQAAAAWAVRVARTLISLEGTYYDAFQRESQRDFRTGGGQVRATFGLGALSLTGSAGYRGLEYKPFPDYSFHGPSLGVELSRAFSLGSGADVVDWNLLGSYTVAARQYRGLAQGTPEPCPGRPEDLCNRWAGTRHQDLNHLLRAEVNYLGNLDATLFYSLEANQSNSHGETFVRHAVGLAFTARLVWSIFATAKGVLQFSRFADPFVVSRISTETFISIEDENRSRLAFQLARDVAPGLAVNLRYSLFVNESLSTAEGEREASMPAFLRHTLFAGLRLEYGRN